MERKLSASTQTRYLAGRSPVASLGPGVKHSYNGNLVLCRNLLAGLFTGHQVHWPSGFERRATEEMAV